MRSYSASVAMSPAANAGDVRSSVIRRVSSGRRRRASSRRSVVASACDAGAVFISTRFVTRSGWASAYSRAGAPCTMTTGRPAPTSRTNNGTPAPATMCSAQGDTCRGRSMAPMIRLPSSRPQGGDEDATTSDAARAGGPRHAAVTCSRHGPMWARTCFTGRGSAPWPKGDRRVEARRTERGAMGRTRARASRVSTGRRERGRPGERGWPGRR